MADAGQFQPAINAAAAQYGIDPNWLSKLLYQENRFQPRGTSPAGAQGIAQFMPATAKRYGVDVNDPVSSIQGAAHYLSDNLKMFGGNQGLATAAYNWGEGNVQNWMKGGGKVPAETQAYVSSITGKPITDWLGAGGASARSAVAAPPPGTTTLTSVPPAATEPGIGSGIPTPAQPNPTAVAAETPPAPQNAGDWVKKFFARPPPTTDAKGNQVQGKSPLENLANSFKPAGGQQQAAAPQPAQFAPPQDPMANLAGPSSQLFQAVSQAASRPLTWSSRPYGSAAGQQYPGAPGTTLNSMGGYYG